MTFYNVKYEYFYQNSLNLKNNKTKKHNTKNASITFLQAISKYTRDTFPIVHHPRTFYKRPETSRQPDIHHLQQYPFTLAKLSLILRDIVCLSCLKIRQTGTYLKERAWSRQMPCFVIREQIVIRFFCRYLFTPPVTNILSEHFRNLLLTTII